MKTSRSRSKNSAIITNSRWLAYATAGAASAFGSAHSAEATIHYSGLINHIFRYSDTAAFQLDQPGDSISLIHTFGTNYRGYAYFNVAGRAGASIVGFYNDCRGTIWASKLPAGQLVSHRPFVPAQTAFLADGNPTSTCAGEFSDGGIGYIGFKFNNGSGDQYGWVRIRTHRRFQQNFKLIDYAWRDVGDRIRAGQTSSDGALTNKGSLGLLALGAAGLLAWRKNRSQTARL